MPTRTVDVGGVGFAYRDLGPRTEVPVIFLHHFTAVLDDWDPRVIDGIATEHRVIAFDNRGVGASGGSVPHTVEEMGRDAVAFIRALGLEKVDLFGFSLGGGVAQMVALQAPDLVRRMILAGTGPRGGEGIDEIIKVAAVAQLKAALTLKDSRNYLFFPRTPEGKRAAKDYFGRLKERKTGRDKRISLQARLAQLKAIRAAGRQRARRPVAHHPPRVRRQRRPRPDGRQQPLRRHGPTPAQRPSHDLPRLGPRRCLPAPRGVRPAATGLPQRLRGDNTMTNVTMAASARFTNLVARRFPALGRNATARQVAKYRSSDGKKGNTIVGRPVFLLDVVGRSSGERRPVMLIHVPRGDDLVVVASAGGSDTTPNWYKNLMAAGGGDVQVGADRWSVAARQLDDGPERDECWTLANTVYPGFDSYQGFTDRQIPVAVLERRAG